MTPLAAIVGALALARITRLVTADYITDRPRRWLQARLPVSLAYLLGCPWCASMWLAPGVALPVVLAWDDVWVQIVLGSLAGSHLAGLVSNLDPAPDYGDQE